MVVVYYDTEKSAHVTIDTVYSVLDDKGDDFVTICFTDKDETREFYKDIPKEWITSINVSLVKQLDERESLDNVIKSCEAMSKNDDVSLDWQKPYFDIALEVRNEMIAQYGNSLGGKCIEASDKIVEKIATTLGVEAMAVEGWCQFDDESYGSDRPWDEHTWVEVPSLNLYIDITADQFNYGMDIENEFPEIIVRQGLPFGMRYDEPSWDEYEEKVDLDRKISACEDFSGDRPKAWDIIHPKER